MLRITVVCCLLASLVCGQEFITVQGGNGTPGGTDANITFLPGPFAAPFTVADYAAAVVGAPAEIIPNGSFGWGSPLSNNPLAMWISTTQSGVQPSGLYAVPFTVNSSVIGLATLSVNLLVDDFLGDATNVGVAVNGIPLPGTNTSTPGSWVNETALTNLDISSLVTTGQNYLYLYGNNTGGPGGVNFSADITVFSTAEYQVNQPGASMDIDGLTSGPSGPVYASRCVGQAVTLTFSSTNSGMPFEIGILTGDPLVPASGGGMVLADGQIVNVSLTAPSITFLNNLGWTSPFPAPSFQQIVSIGAATTTSAQTAIIAPAQPSGLFLSAPNVLDTSAAQTLVLLLPDDGNAQVVLANTPLCHTGGVSFYGTTYNDLYVGSNGDVTFTAGSSDFTATSGEWQTQMPRIGIASDLEPNNYGTVDVTIAGPVVQVNYTNITEWGTGGLGVSSWTVEFNGALAPVGITGFTTDGTWGGTPCVGGASLGAGGTHPALISFDAMAGTGLQANASATDSIIDENTLGMLINTTGWTDFLLPLGDGSAYIVN
ncbi:MAG: hypothetical protein VX913_00660 [Planctomycetota bacterium]|nr:hypothetical protein [Planctomycetota bacterium]